MTTTTQTRRIRITATTEDGEVLDMKTIEIERPDVSELRIVPTASGYSCGDGAELEIGEGVRS